MAKTITDRIINQIEHEVFTRTGICLERPMCCLADLKIGHVKLGQHQIAPATCGAIGMIFDKIVVNIRAGVDARRNNLHITFKFAYDHSGMGGSNGHDTEVIVPCWTPTIGFKN